MSRLTAAIFILILATTSIAGSRPNTATMSCAQAAATVAHAGAVVLSTGQFTYDRFVASIHHCTIGQATGPGIAPTRDNPACQVGFICKGQDWFNGKDD